MKKVKHENEALTGTMETWEQTVFDLAAVFRVTVMRGQRNHDTRDFTQFRRNALTKTHINRSMSG